MKKASVLALTLAVLLSICAVNSAYVTVSAQLIISSPINGIGFQNGSYIYFRDPTTFVSHWQEPTNNMSYPSFLFLQQQGNTEIFGFWSSGVNVTVNSFFVNGILELDCVGVGIVKVQPFNLGSPTSVSGATGVFDNVLGVATLTLTANSVVDLTFGPAPTSPPGGGGYSGPTPTPTPFGATPTPTLPATTIIPTAAPSGSPSFAPEPVILTWFRNPFYLVLIAVAIVVVLGLVAKFSRRKP